MKTIPPAFFNRNTTLVAQELLGKIISVNGYGHVYVYLIYGMYECINFTTEKVGEPGAVLIRAVKPIAGIEKMKSRRKCDKIDNLCSGPGKLCQALGITREMNGLKIGNKVTVYDDGYVVKKISTSSRIGIKDALDLQWRFFVEGSKWTSKV
ncbi:DNA-3-methyladenine glycosylase [Candidatus Woesearchaeota archaeon]|nr:DNA-3-methyladenine glycosylase [Candidatus Woesearchaeota archaeon]